MLDKINIMALRHSAFYSPLLYTIKGGFLKAEGLEANYQLASPHKTVIENIQDGSVHLSQFAVAGSFSELQLNKTSEIVHFAQINQRDGFFIAGKKARSDFEWKQLIGKKVLVDHLFQPLAMFKYALYQLGIDDKKIHIMDGGDVESMDQLFRAGTIDYIHQQGPAPQQLSYDGKAFVLASVGDVIGNVAFSSLCATRTWVKSEQAKAFMRAYKKASAALLITPAAVIAKTMADFFPNITLNVLIETIATYQKLGCWSANPCISESSYQQLLEIFLYNKMISRKYDYNSVIVAPPE